MDPEHPSWRIAAKSPRAADPSRFHPLICHLVDVALVAEALWDDVLPRQRQRSLAGAIGLSQGDARRWVSFLAGIHDLGKASAAFQQKLQRSNLPEHSNLPQTHFAGSSLLFDAERLDDPGHGAVTAAYLPGLLQVLLESAPANWDTRHGTWFSSITGGHHGIFAKATDVRALVDRRQPLPRALGESLSPGAWDEARSMHVKALARQFGVGGFVPTMPQTAANAVAMHLAGLTSVSDWIGSMDQRWHAGGARPMFTFEPDGVRDLHAYVAQRRGIAREVLGELHWLSARHHDSRMTFRSLFPAIREPRPLQEVVDRIGPDLSRGSLVIVEAPMGEGKTEAAFALADGWMCGDSAVRGTYIAMPTQATSNQMYHRFRAFLESRYGSGERDVALQLLHGWASLNADVTLLDHDEQPPVPSQVDYEQEPMMVRVGAAEWFTYRKRGLLAQFGVGTIDQALMSVLQVRHGFVRLFGLADKAIVFDEVHAYDAYMTTLLERLLEWLAALGSPVVLLSATLPAGTRKRLLDAYRAGLGVDTPGPVDPQSAPYPRITWTTEAGIASEHIDSRTGRSLVVERIDQAQEGDWSGVLDILSGSLRDGGCAAVICNTVARAQQCYLALRSVFGADSVSLFHARFLFGDRKKREDDCLREFGPTGEHEVRSRRVLVATQVVEQSLDLDFDVMVSDLAPIDLLLQRSGRLHRHDRVRPNPAAAPILHVLWPPETATGPGFVRASTFVYHEHILLRTWLVLQDRRHIRVPEDIDELIERVYGEMAPEAPGPLQQVLGKSLEKLESARDLERAEASRRYLKRSTSSEVWLDRIASHQLEEESPELHPQLQALTRLTPPTVSVVVVEHGSALDSLTRKEPDREETISLLHASLEVSSSGIVHLLLAVQPPEAWRSSSWLSRFRVLRMTNGEASIGDSVVRYVQELGLLISQAEMDAE